MVKLIDSRRVRFSCFPWFCRTIFKVINYTSSLFLSGGLCYVNFWFYLEVYAAREKNGVYIPKERYYQEESERKVFLPEVLAFFFF